MSDFEFCPIQTQSMLVVISGPSGVGKDTVLQRMKERNLPFHFVVTATTRPPRDNEIHGVDYFFLSHDEFARMINADELLEYAIVYTDYKGIPKSQVRQALDSDKDVIMRLDVQGAETIRKLCPDALLIFLTTQDQDEGLNLRIATARQELKRMEEFDYLVVNRADQLDTTVDTIVSIILAEHHKVHGRKVTL
jgi:guanylate kinase